MNKCVYKLLLAIFLVIVLTECKKVEGVQTLGEFDIPIEPGVVKRAYTYVRQPGGDTIVHIYMFTDKVRNRYWRITKIQGETTMESIYEINDNRKKLIAEYQHQPLNEYTIPEKVKGEILQYEEIDINHRFPGLKTKIRYTNSEGFSNEYLEEDHSIRETTAVWQDKETKVLEIDYSITSTDKIKYLPIFKHHYTYEGKAVFLEGIGLFKWTVTIDNETYETTLVSTKVLKL